MNSLPDMSINKPGKICTNQTYVEYLVVHYQKQDMLGIYYRARGWFSGYFRTKQQPAQLTETSSVFGWPIDTGSCPI